MEKVRVLGVDPSLRNTGIGILTFNSELPANDPQAFVASECQVLVNPQKYTGTDAILNMLDMLQECALLPVYQDVDSVIIESPSIMFNKAWSGGTMSSIAHISGGAAALLGLQKVNLFRPTEWNKARKKDVTHAQTVTIVGDPDTWHYAKRVKSQAHMEHILDAISMSLFWIKSNYLED